jgi:hypothetical protein
MAAIADCEALDKQLSTTCDDLRASMSRVRGAASLVCRMTEQIIANRNHRLALIKELRTLKRDIIEREIRLAEKTDEGNKAAGASGVTAALLDRLQAIILVPGSSSLIMEPMGDMNVDIPVENSVPDIDAGMPDLPTDINIGDIVSDVTGMLWVINDDGAEQLGVQADKVIDGPEVPQSYAITQDGRYVLVVDIEG